MSAWIPPVPDDATVIYDPEAGIGSLADIKAGDIVTAQVGSRPPSTASCYEAHGTVWLDGLSIFRGNQLEHMRTLRAFRLAPVSVPLPVEGGPHAIRATVRGSEKKVPLFGPRTDGSWLSINGIGGYYHHRPEHIVWDGQAYVGPGEQSSEADR